MLAVSALAFEHDGMLEIRLHVRSRELFETEQMFHFTKRQKAQRFNFVPSGGLFERVSGQFGNDRFDNFQAFFHFTAAEIQRWQNGSWVCQESGKAKSRRSFIKSAGYKQGKGAQTRVVKV